MADGWMRWFELPTLTEAPYASSASRDFKREVALISLCRNESCDTGEGVRKTALGEMLDSNTVHERSPTQQMPR